MIEVMEKQSHLPKLVKFSFSVKWSDGPPFLFSDFPNGGRSGFRTIA
jgi:hypothetical protein